ncbi:hypothetical protein ABLG96_14615 [Nakamurella sp. A5-74]|uniref:Lipoprotein n=1 Tax=Nakamurella sp. A5-74 TaxID=3158264 RepID=A0AAU8DM94_9ACTN
MILSAQRSVVAVTAILLLTAACTAGDPVRPVTGSAAAETKSAPVAVDFQYQAQEVDVAFTARPDGTLSVVQNAIVDAGPGVTGTVAVYVKKKLRIAASEDPDGWYFLAPTVGEVAARDLTAAGDLQQLPAAIIDSNESWQIVAATDRAFAAGRHRIQLTYTLDGLLTTTNGRRTLIAPQGVVGGGWYSSRGTGDIARFTATGGAALSCGDEDRGSAETSCSTSPDGTVFRMSDLDNGSTTFAGANGYFFLPDPPGVTATPVDPQFEARS